MHGDEDRKDTAEYLNKCRERGLIARFYGNFDPPFWGVQRPVPGAEFIPHPTLKGSFDAYVEWLDGQG